VGWDGIGFLPQHLTGPKAGGKREEESHEKEWQNPKEENPDRLIKRMRQVNIFLTQFQVKIHEATQLEERKKKKPKIHPYLRQLKSNRGLVSKVLMTCTAYTALLTLNLYILNKNSLEQFSPNNPKC
jgi:hypothetical protein